MKSLALLIALLVGYSALFPIIDEYSKNRLQERDVRYIPQKELLELSVLEFKDLASDMIFLNTLAFVGGRKKGENNRDIWQWLYKALDASSYLNPHNVDPYFIAQGFLTWHGRMFQETNDLLDRGMTFRKNDWRIPFFIGFNYYYFLNKPEKGAQYLESAARMPDSPRAALVVLASRLYSESARTELALAIVKDDLDKSKDDSLREIYQNRLESLKNRLKIEKAVEAYEKINKKKPRSLDVLVAKKFLEQIPGDLEGGEYFLDDQGRVKNTKEVAIDKKAERYR
jgi:tetratricopeptide (TPR) repeat protein